MRFLNSVAVPKNVKGGTLWDFLTSIVLQNIETNEGETLWCNQKNFKKSRIVPKKIRVKNTKGGILCFRGSGRRCFCFEEVLVFRVCFGRKSVVHVDDVEQMNKKWTNRVELTKKTVRVVHFLRRLKKRQEVLSLKVPKKRPTVRSQNPIVRTNIRND